jgi:DNA-directed RNA polymerase subunit RPC12/RpoP
MPKCESCGVEIDDITSLMHHHRCKECQAARMTKHWAKDLGEIEAAGIDRTRETDVDFVYHFFSAADAQEMVQKVTLLGHRASLEHTRNKIAEVWSVCCRARMVPSREAIEAVRDSLCDLADDYENWFLGWGVPKSDGKAGGRNQ